MKNRISKFGQLLFINILFLFESMINISFNKIFFFQVSDMALWLWMFYLNGMYKQVYKLTCQ